MRRKEQYADEIIEMLERTKGGAWASNINLNTKDRVIEVCQNCVDSWSGRKFKDHCTTPPQALEQTRWISVSEKLPEENEYIGDVCKYYLIQDEYGDMHVAHLSNVGWIPMDSLKAIGNEVIAWCELPQPYKGESEESDADSN